MASANPTFAALFTTALLLTGAFAADPTISFDGFGPLKFGMASEQVERILPYDKPYSLGASAECTQLTIPQFDPMGLTFTMERRKFVRLDVEFGKANRETTARTDTGIGLGSAEEDVLKAYPGAVIKPDPADPSWHSILVQSPDRNTGIVFETNGKTVKSIRAGATLVIANVAACY